MTAIYTSAEGARVIEREYRAYLARWPVPSERFHVPTREGDTFVVTCGPPDAPPLLLLHGSGANTTMWMSDVAEWSRDFRVYAVDMIGEPGLSAPSRPPLASGAHVAWLAEVMDALAVPRASFVGISLGGWLALQFASHHPDRVDRMALLCPGGIGRQKVGALLLWLLLRPFGGWGQRRSMRVALGPIPPARTPEARAFGDYVMTINKHFRHRREPLPVLDDDALRRLTTPALVIVGGRDGLIDGYDTRRRLRETAPHVLVDLDPHDGHLIVGRTRQIADFLRDRPEGG
ncbi:alpha/beta fold hydrolase [Sphaerisporangium dianthi]|uniref:Alpha/beta fold hydrolase n=1 Tax=Sphaerisporangium dianthi TaxID=1436120 RepID=A0ABV9CNV7_9ACTN